jgi:hypothetical protein
MGKLGNKKVGNLQLLDELAIGILNFGLLEFGNL